MEESLHLLLTVLVTEKRLKVHPGLDVYQERRRVNLFLASLNSLADLPITSADIYLEFDETTLEFETLIREKIAQLNFPCRVYNYRLQDFKQWVCASELIPQSGLLLLLTYDDHALLQGSLVEFQSLKSNVISATEEWPDLTILGQLSHFPETIASGSVMNSMGLNLLGPTYSLVPVVIPIGAVILSAKKFKLWWETDFTNGHKFVGPENPFGPSLVLPNAYCIGPKSEIFRHLDGYSHVNIKSSIYSPVIITCGKWTLPSSIIPIHGNQNAVEQYLEAIFAIRFSFFGLQYLKRFPLINSGSVILGFFRLCLNNVHFLICIFKGILFFPISGCLFILRPFFRQHFSSGKNRFILHLFLLSASHGFSRFGLITIRQILKRRLAIFRTFI
jgi:hypothetical protein